ncbi:MAG: oxidoreductase [Acidobacteriota bacterium]
MAQFASMLRQLVLSCAIAAPYLAVGALARDPPRIDWQPQRSGVTARLRGISAVTPQVAWASGASGTVLRTTDGGATWLPRPISGAGQLDFRDVDAISEQIAYALSIGPGEASRLYKTVDGGARWELQFANTDPAVFLDAMAFADATHGFAFSDSVNGQFVMMTTADGGRAWTRVPAASLPPAEPGEGAFAASGTNVAVLGARHIWIGTGAARVLRSSDAGRTWQITSAPLHTGESAGIFSIAFRSPTHGIAVGGDYRKEPEGLDNAAFTTDGGVTWTLVKDHGLGGYRSVVAWVPGVAQSAIAVGPSGADWSSDDGRTWAAIPADGFDTVSFAPGTRTGWAAGQGGRIAKLTVHSPGAPRR